MLIGMVLIIFFIRMCAGAVVRFHLDGEQPPLLTQWMLNWGPTDITSAWALGLICAATYMSLSMLIIAKSTGLALALTRCYALATVWLVAFFYFLVMVLSFIVPFINIKTKLYGADNPGPDPYIWPSSVNPWTWLALSILYMLILALSIRRILQEKPRSGQPTAARDGEPAAHEE